MERNQIRHYFEQIVECSRLDPRLCRFSRVPLITRGIVNVIASGLVAQEQMAHSGAMQAQILGGVDQLICAAL